MFDVIRVNGRDDVLWSKTTAGWHGEGGEETNQTPHVPACMPLITAVISAQDNHACTLTNPPAVAMQSCPRREKGPRCMTAKIPDFVMTLGLGLSLSSRRD